MNQLDMFNKKLDRRGLCNMPLGNGLFCTRPKGHNFTIKVNVTYTTEQTLARCCRDEENDPTGVRQYEGTK